MKAQKTVPLQKSEPAHPRVTLDALIYATVALTGAATMVVEIVGTRVLGPVFGVSLYVWAALLVVTLCSLAVGYYVGGALADRTPVPGLLGGVTTLASVVLALAVLCSRGALSVSLSLGPRVGPLLSASLLFAPCIICLGACGPIAVRLSTNEVQVMGHRVGRIYALSTLAGLVSTLVVSFALIPQFETNTILLWTAATLGVVGMIGLRTKGRAIAAALSIVYLGLSVLDGTRPLPAGLRVVERTHSEYSLLEVIEDENRGVRLLRADHSIIGGVRTADPDQGVFGYVHYLDALRFAHPTAKVALQIGLGTGTVANALARHGITSDVVELDAEVVRIARKHFGFETRGHVYVGDARTFINRSDRKYDLIVHDTFTGGVSPAHLFSMEVLSRLKELMHPDGILALNFVGFARGPHAKATWAVHRTLLAAFPHVRLFSELPPGSEEIGNLIFFASSREFSFQMPRRARSHLSGHEVVEPPQPGPILTDAANPLARLELPIADHHFEAMHRLLPEAVWLP